MALTSKQKNLIRKRAEHKSAQVIAAELRLSEDEVEAFIKSEKAPGEPVDPTRKRLFFVLMIAIPFLFFALLEAGLRLGNYRGNDALFIFPTVFDGKYGMPNPNFTSRYFFSTTTLPSPSDDVFLTEKPENGFRVFVLGGSTANGYPYGYNGSFSRVFRDIIQDAAPDRHVEVVNVATSAINSYSIYDQIDEILDQKPDAILIYGGHNEYYGALGVGSSETFGAFPGFVRSYLKLQRFKTFQLLRDIIVRTGARIASITSSGPPTEAGGTLMQRMVGQQQIPLDSDLYELGKRQFESNLNAIFKKFDKAGIPVFTGSLTSNLKDHPPFISVETDVHPAADVVFSRAGTYFEDERYEEAFDAYLYAKDLDALRFRAPESFNALIRTKSNAFDNVFYVPVHEAFMDNSDARLIGFNLMTEHLHPNVAGYHLMGITFASSFLDADIAGISGDAGLPETKDYYYDRMRMTEYDRRIGEHRIKLLMNSWPFVERRDPSGYPGNYEFTSAADSMAFKVVHDNVRWDQAKVRLASYYEETGRLDEALREYDGLMRGQPYNDSPFVFAARIWLGLNNFDRARPFLEQAYAIESSAFTTKMLGAIEIDAGNIDRGIDLLEESKSIEPDDAQMLFNLSGAYALKGEFERADEVLVRLEEINPQFPGARAWRQQLDGHLRNRGLR